MGLHISGSGSKGKKNIYYYHCNSKCGYRYGSNLVNTAFEKELKIDNFHEGFSILLKEILLSNFKNIQQDVDSKKKEISIKTINLNHRLDSAREKYLEDKLDYEDYQMIKNESKKKIDDLEMELQNQKMTRKSIDIRAKLDQTPKTLPNLSQLYITGDNDTKKEILCSIFVEKLEFQELVFRTPKLNSALVQILLIKNQLKNKKKGRITHKSASSLRVTAKGFEPPTLRAEI